MKEALKHILGNEVAASQAINNLLCELPVVALPNNFDLKNIEDLMEQRNRFRGTFKTSSIHDFIGYTEAQTLNDAKMFVDHSERMEAVAIFDVGDEGNPLHCEHRAIYKPKPTAVFAAISSIAERDKLSQRELTDFIEDWLEDIAIVCDEGADESTELRPAQAIASIRSVTVETRSSQTHSEGNFSASRSAMDEVEARSAVDRLPDFLVFEVSPYEGFEKQTIYLRVSLFTGSEKPSFKLRWVSKEAQLEEIGEELVAKLQEGLPEELPVYKGEFSS